MTSSSVNCTKCDAPLPLEALNRRELTNCAACGVPTEVYIFPVLFKPLERGKDGETLLVDDHSGCFYHPQKTATVPCDGCGRFLCALCDIELDGRHLCAKCLETGRKKGKLEGLQNRRVLYDDLALMMAVLPVLFFFVTLVTAPITLYIAIRYWRAPLGIARRTRIRFVLAIVLASLQLLGWTIFFAGMVFV
jgi:hypothetical protein